MKEVLFFNEVMSLLLTETLLYTLMLIAFFISLKILVRWDFERFTQEQYNMESKSYLLSTLISFVIVIKILLLPFFVYGLDALASIVHGAMCVAGVIEANEYGYPLLAQKIAVLLVGGLWLIIHKMDIKAKTYPYMKIKLWLFIALFALMSVEYLLLIFYYISIDVTKSVSCCSVIYNSYGTNDTNLPFGLEIKSLLMLFYLLYFFIILSIKSSPKIVKLLAYIVFALVSYYAVVYFFGTYIYAQPHHHCPFCMLQRAYYYIGYLIWLALMIGVFFGISGVVLESFFKVDARKYYTTSIYWLTFFIVICSSLPLIYFTKSGVWLL